MANKTIHLPYAGLGLGILAVSTASTFIRFAQVEAASVVIAAYRMGIASVVLAPIVLFKYPRVYRSVTKKDLWFGILAGTLLAVHFWSWITSLEYTDVASSVVLVTTTPLWVALASPFTLNERVSKKVKIGLALALFGTVVITLSDVCSFRGGFSCQIFGGTEDPLGMVGMGLALVGAWSAAGYVILGRRVRERLDLVPYAFLVYGSSTFFLSAGALLSGVALIGFSPMTFFWLLMLGLIPQLIGHSAFNWALGFLPASVVAVVLLGEPIGSTLLAMAFLNEVPGSGTIIGAGLILAGILFSIRRGSANSEGLS
jgi:drug/metabolite transporter (DMT)-like permease